MLGMIVFNVTWWSCKSLVEHKFRDFDACTEIFYILSDLSGYGWVQKNGIVANVFYAIEWLYGRYTVCAGLCAQITILDIQLCWIRLINVNWLDILLV